MFDISHIIPFDVFVASSIIVLCLIAARGADNDPTKGE